MVVRCDRHIMRRRKIVRVDDGAGRQIDLDDYARGLQRGRLIYPLYARLSRTPSGSRG